MSIFNNFKINNNLNFYQKKNKIRQQIFNIFSLLLWKSKKKKKIMNKEKEKIYEKRENN
jgi:hypothetical protein